MSRRTNGVAVDVASSWMLVVVVETAAVVVVMMRMMGIHGTYPWIRGNDVR